MIPPVWVYGCVCRTGDNTGNWDHLKWSINIMLQHQLFGILFIGDDICGYDV
jgi:alpha-glucosidase (family GH31 glycosyl hydrolase)